MKQIAGRSVETDDQGYLIDPEDWDESVALAFAQEEGIALGDEHWALLRFVRAEYQEHQVTPDARRAISFLARERGHADAARKALFALFPYGYVQQVCRIAGMRRPRAWSTG